MATSSNYPIKFHSLAQLTTNNMKRLGVKLWSGVAPISSIVNLPDDENVRRAFNKDTPVHKAIRNTLENSPEKFVLLNNGALIIAHGIVSHNDTTLVLKDPSIVNGSQTQGQIKKFIEESSEEEYNETQVRMDVIVIENGRSDDYSSNDLTADISIARNYQNKVKPISIYGSKEYFEDLEEAFTKNDPELSLRKSETDENVIETAKVLQVVFCLIPDELKRIPYMRFNPTSAYSSSGWVLNKFEQIYQGAHGLLPAITDEVSEAYGELYNFIVSFAPVIWEKYLELKNPDLYDPTYEELVRRNGKTRPKEMTDGCIFPILYAHRPFIHLGKKGYSLLMPSNFYTSKSWKKVLITWKSHYQKEEDKIAKKPELYEAVEETVRAEITN